MGVAAPRHFEVFDLQGQRSAHQRQIIDSPPQATIRASTKTRPVIHRSMAFISPALQHQPASLRFNLQPLYTLPT